VTSDGELYARGAATLLASWEAYARGAPGASLARLDGVAVGLFPHGPERSVYNNALLERGLGSAARAAAVDAMESAYRCAGIERYAAWVHESDAGMCAELSARGYAVTESTRAMGMVLDALPPACPQVETRSLAWDEYLAFLWSDDAPAGLLRGADPTRFHALGAERDGATVCAGVAFDHDGDCGVFNVGTLAAARRRGLGTALTACLLRRAAERGCSTASLQATAEAERIYAAVGLRDLGRFLEHAPRRYTDG
jgi:ribosomal protein S18 acetylase RimI-like enzyme